MSKAIREHYKHYSEDFRLRMLSEYYDSGMSIYAFAKKHGIDRGTFLRWTKTHESEKVSKTYNLCQLIINSAHFRLICVPL